jgi:hypothetical protein
MTPEEPPVNEIEQLRLICDGKRHDLRAAVENGGDVDAAARAYAGAFNAYQEAKAKAVGLTVKKISAFHVMKNLGQIIGSIR